MFNSRNETSKTIRKSSTNEFGTNDNSSFQGQQQSQPQHPSSSLQQQSVLPSLSLPKGGGAIRGIGEKFAVNPVTGTASIDVPIYTTAGRSGFGPQLSISYNSGSGNGPFGFGWSLSIPSITRKTDKGLPKYQDADESDVFILSGAEDLVPVLVQDTSSGQWHTPNIPPRSIGGITYEIKRYRPRIEGMFARIERWTNKQTGEIHWRSISKDNITTVYGKTEKSRIADPSDPNNRIFSWLICESYDDKGNAILYDYKGENSQGVDLTAINEQNRSDLTRSANRYIKRIKYGNRLPYRVGETPIVGDLESRNDWMFEVVFDYGEHYFEDIQSHQPTSVFINDDQHQWDTREDAFSSYRARFENRTYRLCSRVLMFHHFPAPSELGVQDYLVRSTEFSYGESPVASFITSITQSGYLLKDGRYLKKSLPSLEFRYSPEGDDVPKDPEVIRLGFEFNPSTIHEEIKEIDAESLENLPMGLDGTRYQWTDLDGEGLAGILTEQAGAWFYKHNLSSLPVAGPDGKPIVVGRFGPLQVKKYIPSFSNLNGDGGGGKQQLMDLSGGGKLDLVKFDKFLSGYFKRSSNDNESWENFTPFVSLPNVNWNDPNLRFIDLTGNGYADILITQDQAFSWYPSLAEKGFGAEGEKTYQALDEEKGPRLVFADITQSIYLADMSGDGLTDLVRIRNGEVCYWPNLGYGHFGTKVTLDNSPWFDAPDLFDQRRIRLADIDGSGTTDIIYLGSDGIHLYFNESGNSLSDVQTLDTQFPHIDQVSSVMAVDLLGNGTSCLVWSSPLPGDMRKSMRYIDLMGGQKPHLLVSIINNMGAETKIRYAPSTKFYLADKVAGNPWITRLTFPVQVVEQITTIDSLSSTKLVSIYKYHHGYFDPVEREFCGFGLIEQWDTESFDQFSRPPGPPRNFDLIEKELFVPPAYTKTWFHTGTYYDWESVSKHFAQEYYQKDTQAPVLPDSSFPIGMTPQDKREAYRSLKGKVLREELYADDSTSQAYHPYTVSEHRYNVNLLQPIQGENRHAAFYAYDEEMINCHYERNPADPRIEHTFILQVDEFGNIQRNATLFYPRRGQYSPPQPGNPPPWYLETFLEQYQLKATLMLNDYAYITNRDDIWIAGVSYQIRSYELLLAGIEMDPKDNVYQFSNVATLVDNALLNLLDFGMDFTHGATQARLYSWKRNYFWDETQTQMLGPSQLPTQLSIPILPAFSENAVSPTQYIADKLGNMVTDQMMQDEGGYKKDSGYWWDQGLKQYYLSRGKFYLPYVTVDPFGRFDQATMNGTYTINTYDDPNCLAIIKSVHFSNVPVYPIQNTVLAKIDYRTLKPWHLIDINDISSQVFYDELGMVAVFTIFKKTNGITSGDSDITNYQLVQNATRNDVISNPERYLQGATAFFYYDYQNQPPYALTVHRTVHQTEMPAGQSPSYQITLLYSDGLGRQLQSKLKSENGMAWVNQPNGSYQEQPSQVRWLTTGKTVFNNKGKPIKQYEPFYSATSDYEFENTLVEFGVTPKIHYDHLNRVIRTDTPKGFFSKIVFSSWRQEMWDENDTVNNSQFYIDLQEVNRGIIPPDWTHSDPSRLEDYWTVDRLDEETQAVQQALQHIGTPKITHFNTMAQRLMEVDLLNEASSPTELHTHYELDITGNMLSITDPRQYVKNENRPLGQIIKNFKFSYDMQRRQLVSTSTDGGTRATLQDALNMPIYVWAPRHFIINTKYNVDPLHRLTEVHVNGNGLNNLVEMIKYGESVPNPKQYNLLGQIAEHYDQAGFRKFLDYDIEKHSIALRTTLRTEYKNEADWTHNADEVLEPENYLSQNTYDALNRIILRSQSDGTIQRYTYYPSGPLKSLDVKLPQSNSFVSYVQDIDYNAKGQRKSILFGNGITTTYEYERETFRLQHLQTVRFSDSKKLQNIEYVYDPVGNITWKKDSSHRTIFHDQSVVRPESIYVYDSLYWIRQSNGRQHPAVMPNDYKNPNAFKESECLSFDSVSINDPTALENYSESYQYDPAGNLQVVTHSVPPPNTSRGWTRNQIYDDSSNRILSSSVSGDTDSFTYDLAGNITQMEHLREIKYNYRDNISSSILIHRDAEHNDAEYYVYDSTGIRVRKVLEQYNNVSKQITEKRYVDGYEIKRIKKINLQTNVATTLLERFSVHVMDDKNRIAIVHRWTIDTNQKETDDPAAVKVHYQLGDHLGSCALELDDQGSVISYEEYYPYGGTAFIAGNSHSVSVAKEVSIKEYRYTGKECDDSTGFYYHGVRYYAPWVGRWISVDPSGIADGLGVYIYSSNNPARYSDATGRTSDDPRQLWLAEHPNFKINPKATRTTRGISPLQHEALRGIDHAFGPGTGLHYSHPEGQPHGITMTGQAPTLTPEPKEENLKRQHQDKLTKRQAAAEGKPTRDAKSYDPGVKPGTRVKQPPPRPFERPMAEYAKSIKNQATPVAKLGAVEAAPVRETSTSTQPKQLSLPFDKVAEAPKVAPEGAASRGVGRKGGFSVGGLAEGVATAGGIAILAHDIYRAKTAEQRIEVAKQAVGGAAVGGLLAEAGLGSAMTAAAIPLTAIEGTKILLKENVIPESTQQAIGKTMVEHAFKSSTSDIDILEHLEIPLLGWRPFAPN